MTLNGTVMVEHDVSRKVSALSGSSEIDGLESFSTSLYDKYRSTRLALAAQLSYQLAPNARVNLAAGLDQPPLGGVARQLGVSYQMNF